MTVREFLRIIRVRWLSVVACALIVLAATAAVVFAQPRVYTATAEVYLQTAGGSKNSQVAVSAQDLQTYVAVLGSPPVVDPLRKKLGLPADYPVDISAEVGKQAPILTITARDSDPQLAAKIANAVGPQLADVAGTFSPLLRSTGATVKSTTVTPASAPSFPTSPRYARDLGLALLAGVLIGIGIALVRHGMDTKVRSEDDIAAISDAPVLAALPQERGGSLDDWANDGHRHHGYVEAIRRLRTSLMFVDVTTKGHSFVITSSVPMEGKTTTAINLAQTMAEAGKRTLLLDADLRRPGVAPMMGLEGSVGLTTVLLGRASLADVVQQRGDTGLFVLPAGEIPPNPSELLGSARMADLFAQMSAEYDFILVDSPPLLPVVDAVLLDKLTAGMVMVVAADRTRKRELAQAAKLLETSDVDVSGFVLNLMTPKSGGYYYQYSYRSARETRRARRAASKEKTSEPRVRA